MSRQLFHALLPLLVAVLLACSASSEPPAPTPSPAPAPAPTATPLPIVTLNAVGDLMLARDLVTLMDAHGSLYPFEMVRPLLADADVTFANMEGTFTERGFAAPKVYTFRTPPRHARGLAEAGIDVVALGNNHSMDFGEEGLLDTLAALDAAGIQHAGAGADEASAHRPAIIEANGLRLAFLSYNAVPGAPAAGPVGPGVAWATGEAIRRDVASALAEADLAIVSLHAGVEYQDAPSFEQRALARAAIDAGAALVLGHHAHVLQGWERYGSGLIVYGLGNFVFDLDYDDLSTLGARPFQTAIVRVELGRQGVLSVSAEPIFIDPAENRPLPAVGEQARDIEQRLNELNGALE